MSNISTLRHEEVFSARENNQLVTVIGAGAIGSRVFASLIELGLDNIHVYDFDNVEAHNLANQLYINSDIGKPKVMALSDWTSAKLGMSAVGMRLSTNIRFRNFAVVSDTKIAGSVFLLVDSMAARRQIFEENLRNQPNVYRVIDVRMAATHGNVFMFNPNMRSESQAWVDSLIDDDHAEVSACGSSLSVGTTASILANLAVWQYMHAKTDPAASDSAIDVYLKPLCINTRKLRNEQPQVQD